jgi:hypothetical protein
MSTLYVIRDWDTHFETAETRKLEFLRWVPTPNKHDGLGFRRLAKQGDAAELFGAWNLLLQIAGRARKGKRGRLERDGVPLDAEDMADMTGFPQSVFERALGFFSSEKMGWIDALQVPAIDQESPTDAAGDPKAPAASPGTPADGPALAPKTPLPNERTKGTKEGNEIPESKRNERDDTKEPRARGNGHSGRSVGPKGPRFFVRPEDLGDTSRLLILFEAAVAAGYCTTSEADRLNFVAAAERAKRRGERDPCAWFANFVRKGLWEMLEGQDEDAARRRLNAHRDGEELRA